MSSAKTKKITATNSRVRSIRRWGLLFLGPVTAAFTIGFIWPFIQGIYLSFCQFRLTSDAKFIGLGNYAAALADQSFRYSFWYTAAFAIVSLVLINVLAFAVAYALTQNLKGSNIFRTVFFAPNLIGGIVLGYIWSMIFDGILSRYGTSVILETKYGFWGLVILMCWQQVGYMMIIYIAGLQAVPEDMLEAAKIDGASKSQTLFKITIPNVMPSITICMFLTLTNSFKLFDPLRPEPRAHRRPPLQAARGRRDCPHDRDARPEHLQHVLRNRLGRTWHRTGQGSHLLHPRRHPGPRPACVHA